MEFVIRIYSSIAWPADNLEEEEEEEERKKKGEKN